MSPRAGSRAAPVLVGSMVGSLVAGRLETVLLALAVGTVAAAAAGAGWPGRRWLVLVAGGAAVAVGVNLYLNPGTPLVGFPRVLGHPATDLGLRDGALLALRLAGAMVALHGLRAAWPGERAADEIARLLRPLERLKVPVRELRAVLALALRVAPVLEAETRRVSAVQALRAGRRPRGLGERLRWQRAMAVPALVHALERAEQLALVLEARHYRIRPLPPPAGGLAGWWAAGSVIAGTALLWRG